MMKAPGEGSPGEGNMVKRDVGPWRMPVEPHGDEGRDKLRKAAGRSTCPLIRGQPNGVTRGERSPHRAREEDSAAGPDRAK